MPPQASTVSATLDDIISRLVGMPDKERKAVIEEAEIATADVKWLPNPGPQTAAYVSLADELLYGGEAGGGKTSLISGLAVNEHKQSLLLRRQTTELRGIKEELTKILGSTKGLNDQSGIWRIPNRSIELGHCQYLKDRLTYQGRPHDLKGFDELTQFLEDQYRYIIAWNRSTDPNQRCRVVATGNPPLEDEGLWVIQYWGPWLDKNHPNPAAPGELRWYTTIGGVDQEVDGADPITLNNGEEVIPRSRTYIPASLEDNPDLMETGYASVLEALPEPYRSALRHGSFTVGMADNEWQVIPSEWIDLPLPLLGQPCCAGRASLVHDDRRG